jgi:3',5'-cyclic AMP phosphodiesterase CpdA
MRRLPPTADLIRTATLAALLTLFVAALPAQAPPAAPAESLTLPLKPGSVRFAVIGDSGRGSREQHEVADRMAAWRVRFPFDFTIMLGDNIYEFAGPRDYHTKFERPYAALLKAGVKFYAAIGNHDPHGEEHYALFNMEGRRYYTFRKGDVRFFVLDSTALDRTQFTWLMRELSRSRSRWKIVYMHHPMYTSGRYSRAARALRGALEPLLVQHGVRVVFSGHEHVYERTNPQHGITYFVSGGAGSLRVGDLTPGPRTAAGFDSDFHFMLVEVADDELFFQTISRAGHTVDHGVVRR